MDERENSKFDETEKETLNSINNSDVYLSQIDGKEKKHLNLNLNIVNINEGVGFQINRLSMSYFNDRENYFDSKETSMIEYSVYKENKSEMPIECNQIIIESDIKRDTQEEVNDKVIDNVNEKVKEKENDAVKQKEYRFLNYPTLKTVNTCHSNGSPEKPYFIVIEKCDVKDYIGFHKLYEIIYFPENQEKRIMCYRRYDNFDKFNKKLRRKFPFIIIPRLTQKNPFVKIMNPDEEFYENRRCQLNFYLNYISKNEFISNSREFFKFTNEADFDEEFFIQYNGKEYNFPESSKNSLSVTSKIFGAFSSIFGGKEELRKQTDEEILLKRMETHYKGITEKYREIKNNVILYLRTLKYNSETYKKLSNSCFYLKDTLESVSKAKDNFRLFADICVGISEENKSHHEVTGLNLQNKFEGFISILVGLCDSFDGYSNYNNIYDNIIRGFKQAKTNNLDNLQILYEELKICEEYKTKFEKHLLNEIKKFVKDYNNTFSDLIDEFNSLLKSINFDDKLISNKFTLLEVK